MENEITIPLWIIAVGVGVLAILGTVGIFGVMAKPSLAPASACYCDAPIPDDIGCESGYSAEARVTSSCNPQACSESSCTYSVFCVKREPGRTTQYKVGGDRDGTCFSEWQGTDDS